MLRVSLANSAQSFPARRDASVLEAARLAGLNLPHACRSGNCGSCRARLLAGEIDYPHGDPPGLSAQEAAAGYVLLCQARPRSELLIEVPQVRPADEVVVRRMPCRIERSQMLSHDVMGLWLRLPAVESLPFEPGQYIDVILDGGRRRSFSIASPPHDARPLELHVRRVPGGEFTERLFDGGARQMLLTIEGPLGQFVYRESAAPVLMVGGGTGLAPLLSMLRHVAHHGLRRDIGLYWGVRGARDLYADATLQALSRSTPGLRYVPVLSEPDAGWCGRTGWVHEAVLADHPRLEAYDIYASGPPAMVAGVRDRFAAHGADPQRLYCDPFDYAPAPPERQRTSASTSD